MSAPAAGRVCVVIPTYQRADLLPRAIRSVLRQSYPDVELLVIDDGSTDDTARVVEALAAGAGRPVRYLRKENGGCASARNYGVQHATGELISFLDSDDELVPTAIEELVGVMRGAGADFVYSPAIEIEVDGRERLNPPVAAGRPERLAEEHFFRTNVRTGSYLLRTSLFAEVGRFDTMLRHNEDSDFVQRLAIRAQGAYSPAPSVRCHVHPGGKSADRVAIARALLHSAERVLTEYPEFAASLGARAPLRVRQLRAALVEELVLAGRLAEATEIAERQSDLPLAARLALRLRSRAPLRARRAWQRWAGAVVAAAKGVRPSAGAAAAER